MPPSGERRRRPRTCPRLGYRAGVDLALPPDDDPRRIRIRRWIAEHPAPTGRVLAEAGYVAPHWPRPWGLEADPISQLVVDEELRSAGISRPDNRIGIGWAGPAIIHAGTESQKDRYLFPLLAGEEIWCQLFSEPDAGSDLASLTTRAMRDGGDYVVNGGKIWTSGAHGSRFGILLARTDPGAPKSKGISYFICPMDAPGVTVTAVRDMTGAHLFNQVFLDEVRLPAANLVGEENRGWALAKVTLANERVSLSSSGVLWGAGPSVGDLVDLVRSSGGISDAVARQRLAAAYSEGRILDALRLRTLSTVARGGTPGVEASVTKALSDRHGQIVTNLAKDLAGASGMLVGGAGPVAPGAGTEVTVAAGVWAGAFLFSPALTIGGGTAEVQRDIIAERALGLPRDR